MLFESPEVTVITPSYNSESYISEAIESVVSQSFQSWEMIIVDDASEDSTVEIIYGWVQKDDRIRLYKNEQNLGPGPTRNRALESARGRYVAFLDSDDKWAPSKLERQVSYIKEKKVAMVFSSYALMDQHGYVLDKIVKAPQTLSYKELLGNTVVGCLTVLIDTEKVIAPRMPDIPRRQPLVLWLKILKEHGSAKGQAEVLAWYRVRPSSISSNKLSASWQVWRVFREYENFGFLKSVFYFSKYSFNGLLRNRSTIMKRLKI